MISTVLILFYFGGIIQALSISIALFKKNLLSVLSNRILLLLLLSITIVLIFFSLSIQQVFAPPFLRPLPTVCWFAIGPLFYLYARSLVDSSFVIKRIHLLYFTVPFYNLVATYLVYFNVRFGFFLFFEDFVKYSYAWLYMYIVHSIVFVIGSIGVIKKRNSEKAGFLLNFFYPFLIVLIIFSIYVLFNFNSPVYHSLIERVLVVVFASFIIYLGIKSIRQSGQFQVSVEKKYLNSTISESKGGQLLNELKEVLVERKSYLDKDFNLSSLSKLTSIKENDLSQIFSQHLKSSFYEIVRDLRLKEVEKRLEDPQFKHIKISSIAEDSGFKSRSAFYRAFKEKHGTSPSQYLKERDD